MILRILAVALIGMGLTLTLVTVVGGLAATALGCVLMHKSRWHDAERTGKPYKQAKRCRWQYVVAALFVFFAIGGKAVDAPTDDTAEQQAIAEQQAAQEQAENEAGTHAAEKAKHEQAEKEAAEKAAAEQAAKEQAEKEAAEKVAKEQAEKEAAEKAAAEQAAKEQAEKEAAEQAAKEQAAAAQTAQEQAAAQQQGETVYITPSGKRWHRSARCAGDNAIAVTMDQVGNRTPCKKCA